MIWQEWDFCCEKFEKRRMIGNYSGLFTYISLPEDKDAERRYKDVSELERVFNLSIPNFL